MEEGRSEVEDDHGSPCGETGYQGHELFGVDGASIRGCKDLHGSTSATRCCGVNLEGLGCQGLLDPGGRVQTPPAKGTVQRGKRQGRVSATIHDKKVGADRGSLRSRSGYHANNHLEHSAEGRREVDKTVTELDDVARALNMLDVESQEGIIKAAVKPVFCTPAWKLENSVETGKFSESQPCEEETDEPNDQSHEEEELCPPLEEPMAASWIAQIGDEDLSKTEAVDSFIAMNEQRKRTWAQAQELKKAARKDRGFFSSRTAVRNRANGSRQLRQSTRRSSNPMDGDGTPKDLRARLRKEKRCFRCKKKGHWKAECPGETTQQGWNCSLRLLRFDIFAHCE